MRLEVTQMCNSVKAQMEAALQAITNKMDEEIKSFNYTVAAVEIKYSSEQKDEAVQDTPGTPGGAAVG